MYRILVVDDEEKIRALIRKYAEFEGNQVTEAENGMEAVELCRRHPEAFDQNGKIVFLLIGRNLGGAGHPLGKELHELLVDVIDCFAGLL